MAKAKPTTAKARAAAHPATFEATCPSCGMTAEVSADVEAVRCRRCGTVVRLSDTEATPAAPGAATSAATPLSPPAAVAETPQLVARPGLAIAIGLGAPVLLLVAYGTAHSAIDSASPDTGTAGIWYMVSLLIAAVSAFGLWMAMAEGQVLPRALWGLLAALPMFAVAQAAGTAYDDDGFAWAILAVPFLAVYLTAIGITAAVLGSRRDGASAAAVLIGGVGLCVGLGASALAMLMTLEEQAAEAREAHEAPAWGFLIVVGILLSLAWARRHDGR